MLFQHLWHGSEVTSRYCMNTNHLIRLAYLKSFPAFAGLENIRWGFLAIPGIAVLRLETADC